jgi:hypothetical protein
MRTLLSTFFVGVCLVATPALAQQNPWVPSNVYNGTLFSGSASNSNVPARAYGRAHKGDTIDTSGWRTSKPATDELYDDACHSSHPVFSCPGTM